jgi:hypothetical protein
MTTEEGRSIPMSTDPARRLRLTLTDIFAANACIAMAFATLVVLAAMTLIGMLLGGISAGIHLAPHVIVTSFARRWPTASDSRVTPRAFHAHPPLARPFLVDRAGSGLTHPGNRRLRGHRQPVRIRVLEPGRDRFELDQGQLAHLAGPAISLRHPHLRRRDDR